MTPRLFFVKTHKESGIDFEDYFDKTNMPNYWQTPIGEIEKKAVERVEYWNSRLNPVWEYKIVGWRIV
jgi:hypothetical protein